MQELNDDQIRAVEATEGPVLVLAGAGSGKTRVLTHRIAHIIETKRARSDEILALTFTNKAAGEMKERVMALLKPPEPPLTGGYGQAKSLGFIGTFHSLGARILRQQARHLDRSIGFTIFDAQDSEKMMREVIRRMGHSTKEYSSAKVKGIVSRWKNMGYRPGDPTVEAEVLGTEGEAKKLMEVAQEAYGKYEKQLKAADAYDFDDLLLTTYELLRDHQDVREWYQKQWRYVSVDEYQDTNALQYELLKLLVGPERNLCVVGDDYQSIYSWRGARVDFILGFEKEWPGATVVYLTQNYRSPQAVLTAANRVIAANEGQMHKELWTDRADEQLVAIRSYWSDGEEARQVREGITTLRQARNLSDIAILYRTNAQSRALEEEFLTHHIPYQIIGGFRFYERAEIKDALALLQLIQTPQSWLALSRLQKSLLPGVGAKTLERLALEAEAQGVGVHDIIDRGTGKVAETLKRLYRAIFAAKQTPAESVADTLEALLLKSGYERWLKLQPDGEERWENVEELMNVASQRKDIGEFLDEVALLTDIDAADDEDKVTCMTLHAAKGLEYKEVFLVGVEEGLLPHMNSVENQAALEEERRLLYVGMTRAQERLTMSWVQSRMIHGKRNPQMPSRFLEHIPMDVVASDEMEEVQSDDLLPAIRI